MTGCLYRVHFTTVNGSKLYDDNEFVTICDVTVDSCRWPSNTCRL
jgi:hypothetical protein